MHWTYEELMSVPVEVYEMLVEELNREADKARDAAARHAKR